MLIAMHAGKAVPEKSGIFVDGEISMEIKTALVGGAIADPEKGSSFRMSLQGERNTEGTMVVARRRGGDNPEIYITGFRYKGKEYPKAGGFIDRIVLHHPGEIEIELDQGCYNGSNPDVKAVKFEKFTISDGKAEVLINIEMKTGKKIVIAYRGASEYDGLY